MILSVPKRVALPALVILGLACRTHKSDSVDAYALADSIFHGCISHARKWGEARREENLPRALELLRHGLPKGWRFVADARLGDSTDPNAMVAIEVYSLSSGRLVGRSLGQAGNPVRSVAPDSLAYWFIAVPGAGNAWGDFGESDTLSACLVERRGS
jgi:hypothetical protein